MRRAAKFGFLPCRASLKHGVERFVEVSTNDVFGLKEGVVMNEDFPFSHWKEPYADTKIEATKIAASIGAPAASRHISYRAAYAASWCLELVWRLLGKKSRPLLTTYTVKNLGSRLQFSIDKAERVLGWKPSVSYEEGFKKTMASFQSELSSSR